MLTPTRMRAGALTALAGAIVLAGSASPASAATRTCAKQATVAAGDVVTWTIEGEDGYRLPEPAEEPAGTRLSRLVRYKAATATSIRFGGHTFKLAAGTYFGLNCWGESPRLGAIHPLVILDDGVVTVRGKRGGISTTEGLFNPHGPVSQTIRVVRTAKKTFDDSFLTGSTTVRKTGGDGWLGLTPYVGSKPGTCRYGKGATAKTTGMKGRSAQGSMTFQGLASFSPR